MGRDARASDYTIHAQALSDWDSKRVQTDLLDGLFPGETEKTVDPARDAEHQRRHPKHVDAGGKDIARHVARTRQERRIDDAKDDRQR